MSFDKAIKHGKVDFKPYYDSRRFDYTCRNNGKCSYCSRNRKHKHKRKEISCKDQIKEYSKEEESN